MNMTSMKLGNSLTAGDDIAAIVMGHFEKGGDVFFSRTHSGVAKIKVRYGPFKLRTARFHVSDKVAITIKDLMRARINKSKSQTLSSSVAAPQIQKLSARAY